MRKFLVFAALTMLAAGCTSHRSVTVDGTTVTHSSSGGSESTTVKSANGTASVGKNVVDLASLGLPIYPGAQQSETEGYSARLKSGNGQMVVMSTTDPFDTVYKYYQAHMPAGSEQMHRDSGGVQIATFDVSDPATKGDRSVMITEQAGKTSIMLTTASRP